MTYLEKYRDKEKRKAYAREYQRKYGPKYRKKRKDAGNPMFSQTAKYVADLRIRALKKLGELKCAECGCAHEKILELNHINGGGREERRNISHKDIFRKIIRGENFDGEYNVLCRVCNARHYVSEILKIKGHKVTWS